MPHYPLIKRSLRIGPEKRNTSISLEPPFWRWFDLIVEVRKKADKHYSANTLLTEIDAGAGEFNRSSATRMYILDYIERMYVVETVAILE
jgi:predicted DNA-binding ribbon-helix-helix protein